MRRYGGIFTFLSFSLLISPIACNPKSEDKVTRISGIEGQKIKGVVVLSDYFTVELDTEFVVERVETLKLGHIHLRSGNMTVYFQFSDYDDNTSEAIKMQNRLAYARRDQHEMFTTNEAEYLSAFVHGVSKDDDNYGLYAEVFKGNHHASMEFSFPDPSSLELARKIWRSVK